MSEEKSNTKEYSKGDFTIVWDSSKCIHAGICARTLPNVYDPKGRPWIKPENASVEELKSQIDKCPSGALSYSTPRKADESEPTDLIKVHARMNGSLLIEGNMEVTKQDGTVEIRMGRATFCRCGASENMPFCDSSHKRIDFKG